jgi:hypothetical protein
MAFIEGAVQKVIFYFICAIRACLPQAGATSYKSLLIGQPPAKA